MEQQLALSAFVKFKDLTLALYLDAHVKKVEDAADPRRGR